MTTIAWIGSIYLIGFLLTWIISVRLEKPRAGEEGWEMLNKLFPSIAWPGWLLVLFLLNVLPLLFFPERLVKKVFKSWKTTPTSR